MSETICPKCKKELELVTSEDNIEDFECRNCNITITINYCKHEKMYE